MIQVVCEREHVDPTGIRLFQDVASSFGARKGLTDLVEAMIRGEVSSVWSEHRDRFSRVPALTKLVQALADARGIAVHFVDQEEKDPNEVKNGLEELLEFATVIANRTNSRKQADRRRIMLSAEVVRLALEMKEQGRTIREIVEKGLMGIQG